MTATPLHFCCILPSYSRAASRSQQVPFQSCLLPACEFLAQSQGLGSPWASVNFMVASVFGVRHKVRQFYNWTSLVGGTYEPLSTLITYNARFWHVSWGIFDGVMWLAIACDWGPVGSLLSQASRNWAFVQLQLRVALAMPMRFLDPRGIVGWLGTLAASCKYVWSQWLMMTPCMKTTTTSLI